LTFGVALHPARCAPGSETAKSFKNCHFKNFTRVGTYVQCGSKFCFVVVLVVEVTVIAQNTALLSYFAMHSALHMHSSLARQILHYYPIFSMHSEIFRVMTNFDQIWIMRDAFGNISSFDQFRPDLDYARRDAFRNISSFDQFRPHLDYARACERASVLQWQDQTACACCSQTSPNVFCIDL
jgi:hypothetical protein